MLSLLTIKHADFTLRIDCSRYDRVWDRAQGNIPAEDLLCNYQWDEGVEWIEFREERVVGQCWEAIFFDNTDYPVWVDFEGSDVEMADVMANRQSVYENFAYHKTKHVLSGFLNYGNEIGKSCLEVRYVKGGERKSWSFGYEVLSQKLNYREHWKKILEDIEQEYRMLSLDFLKKTFHSFTVEDEGEKPDLIWWNIFKDKQAELVKNVKLIIDRPKQRLRDRQVYRRADQLKRIKPRIEREFAEHRWETEHVYVVEQPQLNRDTVENRFLKYALNTLAKKHEALAKKVASYNDVAQPVKDDIDSTCKELDGLKKHPFFRGIGPFKGLTQESQVLQKATGYSQVYRIWLLLSRAYSLNDGLYRLETKDIATLYEIWCFIEVKNIVQQLLSTEESELEVDNRSRIEMHQDFTYELSKGEKSHVLFRQGDVELAELIYNPKEDKQSNQQTGMENVVSRTVPQKPDIVLQLTKKDNVSGMKLTFLFDAKYRLGDKDGNRTDVPPDDAINQMHRYRDALFYSEKPLSRSGVLPSELKREVIGGYILFPGDGSIDNIKNKDYYRSVGEVNIGAFPLRPKDEENRRLLEDFIKQLIEAKTDDLIGGQVTIPQKGLRYELEETPIEEELVLVGYYRNADHLNAITNSLIYNARALSGKNPLALVPGYEKAKYLLLYQGKEKHIYELKVGCQIEIRTEADVKGNVMKVDKDYKPTCAKMGEMDNAKFYYCIHLESALDMADIRGVGVDELKVPSQGGPYDKPTFYTTLGKLISGYVEKK